MLHGNTTGSAIRQDCTSGSWEEGWPVQSVGPAAVRLSPGTELGGRRREKDRCGRPGRRLGLATDGHRVRGTAHALGSAVAEAVVMENVGGAVAGERSLQEGLEKMEGGEPALRQVSKRQYDRGRRSRDRGTHAPYAAARRNQGGRAWPSRCGRRGA